MKADLKAIFIILALLILFSINSFAAIPSEQKMLDIYQVLPVAQDSFITQETVAAIVPTDIPDGSSEGTVGKMVADKALKAALKSDFVKKSSVGQTADNLKDGINTEVAIGGDPADPTSVKHKFKMKLDPIQTRARLQYSGYANVSASFDEGESEFKVTEDFNTYKVNLVHTSNEEENLSIVQIEMPW